MISKNCLYCGKFLIAGKCGDCIAYALSLKNTPARINGFDGRVVPAEKLPEKTQKQRIEEAMQGVQYE